MSRGASGVQIREAERQRNGRIVRAYLADPELTMKQIASRFGCDPTTVTKVLADAGVRDRRPAAQAPTRSG